MKKSIVAAGLFGMALSLFAAKYDYEFSPMLGVNFAEGNINVDNYIVIGGELQFNNLLLPEFKPELSLFYGKATYNEPAAVDGEKSDVYRIAFNGVYEYHPLYKGVLVPFAKAGVGYESMSDTYTQLTGNHNSVYVDVAGGAKLLLTKEWALKAEALYMLKDNSTRWDSNFELLVGVSYSFGAPKEVVHVAMTKQEQAARQEAEAKQHSRNEAAAAQGEDLFADDDKDGVLNSKDECPNTPAGVKIMPNGCEVDDDNDGVPNSKDACAATPAGAKVDAKGCEVDSDGDGLVDSKDQCPYSDPNTKINPQTGCEYDDDNDTVPNSKDLCPNTPAGAQVDVKGCELDDDHDGVVNSKDKCAFTPEGAKVDANGCELDSDGDGVVDSLDECPNTPQGVIKVDDKGCLQEVNLSITFKPGSTEVNGDSLQNIRKFAEFLNAAPIYDVKIVGYTDSTGSAAANKRLSLQRAKKVKELLIAAGVDATRISVEGRGEADPIASNATKEGRAKNRRIEAILQKRE